MSNTLEYCNWEFRETIRRSNRYGIKRDCDEKPLVKQEGYGPYDYDESATMILGRGSVAWEAYKASLEPRLTGEPPDPRSKCPNCGKYVNAVNPYDDGETWRK